MKLVDRDKKRRKEGELIAEAKREKEVNPRGDQTIVSRSSGLL